MERQSLAKVQKVPARINPLKRTPALSPASGHPLLGLQRSIGNHAVQRLMRSPLIQTKLQMSKPGDPSEQEADRVADSVMRMPQAEEGEAEKKATEEKEETVATKLIVQRAVPAAVREDDDEEEKVAAKLDTGLPEKEGEGERETVATKLATDSTLQRQSRRDEEEKEETSPTTLPIKRQTEEEEEQEKVQPKSLSSQLPHSLLVHSVPSVQRLCTECDDEKQQIEGPSGGVVHRKTAGQTPAPTVTSSVASRIHAMNSGGSPLPNTTRAFFEPRFGVDFSQVRVHADSRAAEIANSLNARAFTVGSSIAFGAGRYSPHSDEGRHLLAHELTHVVQQSGEQQPRTTTGPGLQKAPVSLVSPTIQRQGDGTDHLTSLREMLDRTNVPEEEVLALLPQLTETERATVTTDPFYKNGMASAFNTGEMVQAVRTLALPLNTQLEWVEAATSPSNIEYSEIQSLVTAAQQADRDLLKTNRWRNFFVGVCDNSTIITAVTDLHFDLQTQLEWIEEEASPSNIEYSQIQSLVTAASQPDRDVLKTTRWRDFFVGVCDNSTIITAVTDLHFDLVTQLEWIEEEASPSNLDYSQIQPLITAAQQTDRDLLKTTRWRDFFVGVCTNATIKTALEDLNFDLLTTIQWLLEEVSVSNIDFTWLCNRFRAVNAFPPGEDTIACAIMERDIRDGTFNSSPEHTPAGWITRAHNQLLVATEMAGLVGQQATWRGSGPGSGTTFQIWASAAVKPAIDPPLGAVTVINCWEMIMLAAYRSGVLSWARIHSIYTSGVPNWGAFLVNQLSFNNRIRYNPGSPAVRPVVGDIVFFDGASHVALATGNTDALGRTQVYSFWPPPNTAFTAGGTLDDVKITTIEELNDYWVGKGKPAFKLEFTTPNW